MTQIHNDMKRTMEQPGKRKTNNQNANENKKKEEGKGKKEKKVGSDGNSAEKTEEHIPTEAEIMMSDVAMENLYFIAHDAPHALEIRGFEWPDNPKKKKKKK